MDNPTRLDRTSLTLTVPRQTPKNEFGQVLQSAISAAVKAGGAIIGQLPGAPIISAAVNSVSAVTSQTSSNPGAVSSQRYAATGLVNNGGPIGGNISGAAGSADAPVFSNPEVNEMAQMSSYYLKIQNEMQQESRSFNAISNVIKVRHDSAKAAINNIR
jgi:hypothetical protein